MSSGARLRADPPRLVGAVVGAERVARDGARAQRPAVPRVELAAGAVVQRDRHVPGVDDARRPGRRSARESSPTASSRNEPPPGRAGAAVNVQLCSSTSRAVAGAAGTASPAAPGDGRHEVGALLQRHQAGAVPVPGAGRRLAITTANQPSLSPAASSRSSTFTRRTWHSSVASSLVGSRRRSSGPGASTASTSGSPPRIQPGEDARRR